MSQSAFWQRENVKYTSASVAETLRSFRASDLADPELSRRWIEFAKGFSRMALTAADIEQMSFESFYALKQIMAATLTNLSEETVRQNDKMESLGREERSLKRDIDSLGKIEEENRRKEAKLLEEYAKLDAKEKEMMLKLNNESSILDSEP